MWLSRQATLEAIAAARQAFDRALTLDPKSIVALKEYAMFLEHQGELDQAKDMLERALEIMPDDPEMKARHAALLTALAPPREDVSVPEAPKSVLERLTEAIRRWLIRR